jgi:hypothetical protein
LISFPEHADRILENVSPPDFLDHRMRRLAELILGRRSRDLAFDASALLSVVEDDATRDVLIECSMSEQPGSAERIVADHILCFRKRVINREIEDLRQQIRRAEREGNGDLLESLLARRQELARQLRLLST